jgi:hypothetical protein
MLKVTVNGEPDEIGNFFLRLKECDGMTLEYRSDTLKRAAHHKWGSAKAGIHVKPVLLVRADDLKHLDFVIREKPSKNQGKKKAVKGFVYLMAAYGESGLLGYKIGKTTAPHSRRRTFSVKFNFAVKFLALISTDDHSKMETMLHQMFSEKRLGSSEFFELSSDDMEMIVRMMSEADKQLLKGVNRE